jgi:hypothetical protein
MAPALALDREASTAAAAALAVGLAAGWLLHRHADDIKAAGAKAKEVRVWREGREVGWVVEARWAAVSASLFFSSLFLSPQPSHPHQKTKNKKKQSVSSAFGKLKAKVA